MTKRRIKIQKISLKKKNIISDNYLESTNCSMFVLKKKRKRGRKRNPESNKKREHNRNSKDNMKRKAKTIFFNGIFNFLNNKIKKKYPKNKLFKVKHNLISDISVNFNKKLMIKTLGEIFINNPSTKYKKLEHNKELIDELSKIDKEMEEIFKKKLIDCLNHINEKKKDELLNGLEQEINVAEFLLNNNKNESRDYINSIINILMNLGEIFEDRKPKEKNKNDIGIFDNYMINDI